MYLLINSSPNKDGNTAYLLNELKKELARLSVENEIIYLQDYLDSAKWSFCTACTRPCSKACFKNTKLEELYNKIGEATGLIIGSPVYFGLVSAQLKTLFDKSTSYRKQWVGKKLSAITVGASRFGGQETTANAIYQMGLIHGMEILNDGVVDFDGGHYGVQAQAPAQNDETAINRIKILAKRIESNQ